MKLITFNSLKIFLMKVLTLKRSIFSKNSLPVVCKTAAEAVQSIKSNDIVYVHSVSAAPKTLLDGLASRAGELRGVQLCHIHLEKPNPCLDEKYEDSFFVNHYFVGANARSKLSKLSNAYTPIFLSDVPK
jgi:acyl-CoA hydrolase